MPLEAQVNPRVEAEVETSALSACLKCCKGTKQHGIFFCSVSFNEMPCEPIWKEIIYDYRIFLYMSYKNKKM